MSAPDLDALYAEAELEAVDALMQQRFGTKPIDDLSGMFTGQSSLAPAPASEPPAAGGNELPTIHQGPRAEAPSEDAAMDFYMRTFFPGSVG